MSTANRRRRRRSRAAASARKKHAPPGSPIYTGEALPDVPITVRVVDYGPDDVRELEADNVNELGDYRSEDSVTWINLDGIHRAGEVQAVGAAFGLHPLWIEDILNPTGRPKAEAMDDKVLVITKMALVTGRPEDPLESEQIAVILGPGWVLTFQERPGDVWEPLRERIRNGAGRVRRMRVDYLLHALLDAVVDNYFVALEAMDALVDALEDEALGERGVELRRVYELKGELAALRQVIWPTREAVAGLLRRDSEAIRPETAPYFRDLYDHVVQVMDVLETSRERVMGVFELHLAVNGHRMNQAMRVLTVVSTIFIPMTFLAGVYGMNFQHMPELAWRWGYPAIWGVMLGLGVAMAIWFRTRRWM